MNVLVDLFAVLTAAAGWYYLFFSKAARNLESVETRKLNVLRVRLRRIGGVFMLMLAALFFAGVQPLTPLAFLIVWIGILLALAAIVVLALIDLRLTWRVQKNRRRDSQ